MAAIQSHLEAKRLVDKYGKEAAIDVAMEKMLTAYRKSKSIMGCDLTPLFTEVSYWVEVIESIESV